MPVAVANIHNAGVRMASWSVQTGSSTGGAGAGPKATPLAAFPSTSSSGESPSGLNPTSSGCCTMSSAVGRSAMPHTSMPSTIQASRHPLVPMITDAMSGKATRPTEWEPNRMPEARPRILTN